MVYFVNASVMHKMYAHFLVTSTIGPKRSAWILVLGVSGMGNGARGSFFLHADFHCWQCKHV
jgi:hypothetical protein